MLEFGTEQPPLYIESVLLNFNESYKKTAPHETCTECDNEGDQASHGH
jgi:hypothetical protein